MGSSSTRFLTMRRKKILFAALVLSTIALITIVTAAKAPSRLPFFGWLVSEVVKGGRKVLIIFSARIVHYFYLSVFDNMPSLILANPPLWSIKHYIGFFVNILQPFYVFAIMLTGAYLIFFSQSPGSRAQAKYLLGKFVVGLALISVSPLLVNVIYYASETLATQIMNLADPALATGALRAGVDQMYGYFNTLTAYHRNGGIELFLLETVLLMMVYIILVMRYVMVGILGVLLPVTIFLYSWHTTRHVGKMLLEQTIVWVFMQVGWAVGIVVIAVSLNLFPAAVPAYMDMVFQLALLLFFVAVPFMILGIMNWLGLTVLAFEVVQAAPLSSGAVVFGETAMERKDKEVEEKAVRPPENY